MHDLFKFLHGVTAQQQLSSKKSTQCFLISVCTPHCFRHDVSEAFKCVKLILGHLLFAKWSFSQYTFVSDFYFKASAKKFMLTLFCVIIHLEGKEEET